MILKKIKANILIFLISIVFINCTKSIKDKDNSLVYNLGEVLSKDISNQIKHYNQVEKSSANNFFIIIGGSTTETDLTRVSLSYCDNCYIKDWLDKSNRVTFINEMKVPVMFFHDEKFMKKKYKDKKGGYQTKYIYQIDYKLNIKSLLSR